MDDHEADRKKAMAAVRAMFEKYKLVAAQRPEDHIVSTTLYRLLMSAKLTAQQDFDREVMENLKLVDAGLEGSVAYEMTITPNFSNLNSTSSLKDVRFRS
jgi:acyl-coenzyme A thioesterase 13